MKAAVRGAAAGLLAVLASSGGATGQAASAADERLLEAIDWYTGVAGHVDDARARALVLETAADPSRVLARMWVARAHSRGRMGLERNERLADSLAAPLLPEVRAMAARGDVEAAFLMATAYDEGLGVAEDPDEAVRWYRRAATRNHVLAAHNLGNVFRDGRGVDSDAAAAAAWWLRAARAGDAIAQLRLGESYEAGRGVSRHLPTATAWYRRAAGSGNGDAAAALDRLGSGSR